MSNDQRPKNMPVYGSSAAKLPPAAAPRRALAPAAAAAPAAVDVETDQPLQVAVASAPGIPAWAVLLFLVAGTAGGGAVVALLPRVAPQLLLPA